MLFNDQINFALDLVTIFLVSLAFCTRKVFFVLRKTVALTGLYFDFMGLNNPFYSRFFKQSFCHYIILMQTHNIGCTNLKILFLSLLNACYP